MLYIVHLRIVCLNLSFPDRRRSNVVKEVEKLKENREKRRAQQAQILEEQETLRSKDPTDPNWEFRSMVQVRKLKILNRLSL